MDTTLKSFLANLGALIGGSASDAAVECVRIATHTPALAGCLPPGADPQPVKVELGQAAVAAPSDETELADAKATIARLEAEIEAIKASASPKAPKAAKAPKAPKAPKAAKAPATTGITGQGKLKALIIDGNEVDVRSWRAGAVHMMSLVYTNGKSDQVHSGWYSDTLNKYSVKMDGLDNVFADSPGTLVVCEKRIRKAAEVLGVSVTIRIVAEDGTSQDVAL